MRHLLYTFLFLMFLNTSYSQQYKYENWPLEDNSKEVEASFGEFTPAYAIMHDALDIYGAGKRVVSVRNGTVIKIIKPGDQLYINTLGMIIIQVKGSNEFDVYMHVLVNGDDLKENRYYDKNTFLGTVDATTGEGSQRHLHFSRLSSNFEEVNKLPGYEPDGSNCLHPLLNFTDDVQIDPQLQAPKLEKLTSAPSVFFKNNSGETYSLNSQSLFFLKKSTLPTSFYDMLMDYTINNGASGSFNTSTEYWNYIKSIVTNSQIETYKNTILDNSRFPKLDIIPFPANTNNPYTVYGKIDIMAEAYDKLNTNPLNHGNTVNAIGYWIENISGGGSSVICEGQKPYLLYRMDDSWMKDISIYSELPFIFNEMLYDNEKMEGDNEKIRRYTHYIVTNTKGTSGKAENIDPKQYWNTLAHTENTAPNGYNPGFKQATINKEAKFKDGEYRVHIWMEDLLYPKYPEHGVDDGSTVIVLDNYTPYVERVEVKAGTNPIYDENWGMDATDPKLLFSSVCMNAAAVGNADVIIKIYPSEPMASLSISVTGFQAGDIVPSPNPVFPDPWEFKIAANIIGSKYIARNQSKHQISITGQDIAGNGLQGFNSTQNEVPYTDLRVRDNQGNWTPAIALLPDTRHYFKIGDTFKSAGLGCLNIDFTGPTMVTDDDEVTFTSLTTGGAVTAFHWVFEGGKPAMWDGEFPDPVSYADAPEGNYLVSLTIQEDDIVHVPVAKTITVEKSEANQAEIDFTYDHATSTFTGQATGNVASWKWTFQNTPFVEEGPGKQVVIHNLPSVPISLNETVTLTVTFSPDNSTKSLTQRIVRCGYPYSE